MEDALLGSLGSLSWNTQKSLFSENRTRDPCNRSNHLNLCRPLTVTISARQPGSDRRENAPRPDSKTQTDELSQATHCFKPSRQLQQRKASTPKQPRALKVSEALRPFLSEAQRQSPEKQSGSPQVKRGRSASGRKLEKSSGRLVSSCTLTRPALQGYELLAVEFGSNVWTVRLWALLLQLSELSVPKIKNITKIPEARQLSHPHHFCPQVLRMKARARSPRAVDRMKLKRSRRAGVHMKPKAGPG